MAAGSAAVTSILAWQKNRVVAVPERDARFRNIGERNGFGVDNMSVAVLANQRSGEVSHVQSLDLKCLRAPKSLLSS